VPRTLLWPSLALLLALAACTGDDDAASSDAAQDATAADEPADPGSPAPTPEE
jgi:hypothetical protein